VNPATSTQAHIGLRFEGLLGPQFATTDQLILDKYAIDGMSPHVIVRPGSAEEISATLRIASEEDWSVAPYGGGTRQHVGRTPERVDIVLATDRLGVVHRGRNEVIEVEVLDVEGLHHVGTAGLQELPDLVLIPVAAERGLHRVRRSRHLAECQCRCKHFDEKRFHPFANSISPTANRLYEESV